MSILVIGMAGTEGYLLAAIYACHKVRLSSNLRTNAGPRSVPQYCMVFVVCNKVIQLG